MKKVYTKEELQEILSKHKKWLFDEDGGERADLSGADLSRADLSGADLSWADLSGTYLYGAYLSGAICPLSCPDTGAFVGWKKAVGCIVKLKITEDAKRSSTTSRKCRCSKAEVLSLEHFDGTPYEDIQTTSQRDSSFIYRVGETVEVLDFDENRWNECSTGIHFFITRQEAVDY